jgi:hypothetical protein
LGGRGRERERERERGGRGRGGGREREREEGGREGGREGGKEGGREGGKERESLVKYLEFSKTILPNGNCSSTNNTPACSSTNNTGMLLWCQSANVGRCMLMYLCYDCRLMCLCDVCRLSSSEADVKKLERGFDPLSPKSTADNRGKWA